MKAKELKQLIRKQLSSWMGQNQKLTREFITEKSEQVCKYIEESKNATLDPAIKKKVISSLCDDFLGLGPIQKHMEDESVTEIMINGPKKVYIEKDGKKQLSDAAFDDEDHLRYVIERMIAPSGKRVDESSAYVDFSINDGSRVNVILPPLSVGGATVTIRKFLTSIQDVEDLVKLKTVDQRMAQFLKAAVKAKLNIMFSGATGSGKTTTLEVLSSYIGSQERIITIEDALELNLRQEHVVRLLTRSANIEGRGEVNPRDLFRNTLRMRPTRIILGEVRGEEAMDYLQALNSGHRGSLAVIHASSPSDVITRLETMALYASLNLPMWAIREQISSGLDLIVQHEQLQDGSRKITHITEVGELKNNQIVLQDLFKYEVKEVGEDSKVQGEFKAVAKPSFLPVFKKKGVKLDPGIFSEKK